MVVVLLLLVLVLLPVREQRALGLGDELLDHLEGVLQLLLVVLTPRLRLFYLHLLQHLEVLRLTQLLLPSLHL